MTRRRRTTCRRESREVEAKATARHQGSTRSRSTITSNRTRIRGTTTTTLSSKGVRVADAEGAIGAADIARVELAAVAVAEDSPPSRISSHSRLDRRR